MTRLAIDRGDESIVVDAESIEGVVPRVGRFDEDRHGYGGALACAVIQAVFKGVLTIEMFIRRVREAAITVELQGTM